MIFLLSKFSPILFSQFGLEQDLDLIFVRTMPQLCKFCKMLIRNILTAVVPEVLFGDWIRNHFEERYRFLKVPSDSDPIEFKNLEDVELSKEENQIIDVIVLGIGFLG